MWAVGLTIEIKLSFQISPAQCGRGRAFCKLLEIHKKLPEIPQKVAQTLLKESQRLLFVTKVAQTFLQKKRKNKTKIVTLFLSLV